MGGLYKKKNKRFFMAYMLIVAVLLSAFPVSNTNGQERDLPCSNAKGAQLYESLCASCHNALEASTRRGRNASRISSALEHQAVHSSLTDLTEKDIASIACALSEESQNQAEETGISKKDDQALKEQHKVQKN
jgi:mono/diheme cytochrome c family protein